MYKVMKINTDVVRNDLIYNNLTRCAIKTFVIDNQIYGTASIGIKPDHPALACPENSAYAGSMLTE
jgi:hypothetical protein